MKEVEICLLRKFLGNEVMFVTEHEYIVRYQGNSNWSVEFMHVDIPDRFHPKEDEEGRVIVAVGGRTVGLGTVLEMGPDGLPRIVWFDEELNCRRTFTLKPKKGRYAFGEEQKED